MLTVTLIICNTLPFPSRIWRNVNNVLPTTICHNVPKVYTLSWSTKVHCFANASPIGRSEIECLRIDISQWRDSTTSEALDGATASCCTVNVQTMIVFPNLHIGCFSIKNMKNTTARSWVGARDCYSVYSGDSTQGIFCDDRCVYLKLHRQHECSNPGYGFQSY